MFTVICAPTPPIRMPCTSRYHGLSCSQNDFRVDVHSTRYLLLFCIIRTVLYKVLLWFLFVFFSVAVHRYCIAAPFLTIGQLMALAKQLRQESGSGKWLDSISHLLDETQTVASELERSLSSNPSKSYNHRMQNVVQRALYSSHTFDRRVDLSQVWQHINSTTDISTSIMLLMDNCYSILVGSRQKSPCVITDDCWHVMSQFHVRGYRLTHEVLYLVFGHSFGCENAIEQHTNASQVSLDQFESVLCSNVLASAIKSYETGLEAGRGEDLFMEQLLVCSLLGFKDFYRPAWLRYVMSLQNTTSGCFRPSLDIHYDGGQSFHRHAPRTTQRHLLVERELANNCFVHMTSLGLGLLSIYLHYLLLLQLTDLNSSEVTQSMVMQCCCVLLSPLKLYFYSPRSTTRYPHHQAIGFLFTQCLVS